MRHMKKILRPFEKSLKKYVKSAYYIYDNMVWSKKSKTNSNFGLLRALADENCQKICPNQTDRDCNEKFDPGPKLGE